MRRAGPELAVPTAASPEEAAAIAAAIERFLHDHTLPAIPVSGPDPWTRAAMREGVARQAPADAHPWMSSD